MWHFGGFMTEIDEMGLDSMKLGDIKKIESKAMKKLENAFLREAKDLLKSFLLELGKLSYPVSVTADVYDLEKKLKKTEKETTLTFLKEFETIFALYSLRYTALWKDRRYLRVPETKKGQLFLKAHQDFHNSLTTECVKIKKEAKGRLSAHRRLKFKITSKQVSKLEWLSKITPNKFFQAWKGEKKLYER